MSSEGLLKSASFPPPIGVEGKLQRESSIRTYFLDPRFHGDDKKKAVE